MDYKANFLIALGIQKTKRFSAYGGVALAIAVCVHPTYIDLATPLC